MYVYMAIYLSKSKTKAALYAADVYMCKYSPTAMYTLQKKAMGKYITYNIRSLLRYRI